MRLPSFLNLWIFISTLLVVLIFAPDLVPAFELPKLYAGILAAILLTGYCFAFPEVRKRDLSPVCQILLFMWFLLLVSNIFISIIPTESLFGVFPRYAGILPQLLVLLTGILLFYRAEKESFITTIKSTSVAGGIVALIAVVQKVFPLPGPLSLPDLFLGRVFSTLGHPSHLGVFLVISILTTLHLSFEFPKAPHTYIRRILTGSLMLQFLALFLTGSRGAFLGCAIGVTYYLWKIVRSRSLVVPVKLRRVGFTVFLLTSISGIVLLLQRSLNGLETISVRSNLFTASLEAVRDRWWGWGLDMQGYVLQQWITPSYYGTEDIATIPDRAHSVFLDTLITSGFPGLLLLLLSIGFLFITLRKRQDPTAVLLMALGLAALMTLMTTFSSFSHLFVLTILFATGLAYLSADKAPVLISKQVLRPIQIQLLLTVVFLLFIPFVRGTMLASEGLKSQSSDHSTSLLRHSLDIFPQSLIYTLYWPTLSQEEQVTQRESIILTAERNIRFAQLSVQAAETLMDQPKEALTLLSSAAVYAPAYYKTYLVQFFVYERANDTPQANLALAKLIELLSPQLFDEGNNYKKARILFKLHPELRLFLEAMLPTMQERGLQMEASLLALVFSQLPR